MPSQPVLEALEALHQNLDKMKPAIKQFQIAERLAEEVNKLPEMHTSFIAELHKAEKKYHATLQQQILEHENSFQKKVELVVDTAHSAFKSVSDQNDQITKLRNNIQSYYSKLDGMQLPIKLDTLQKSSDEKLHKLDGSAVHIITTIQSLQPKLDLLYKNVGESIKEESEKQQRNLQALQDGLFSRIDNLDFELKRQGKQQKTQQTLILVTWVLVICSILVRFYFKR